MSLQKKSGVSTKLMKMKYAQIRQIAHREGISPQRLVENWLREKIQGQLRVS